MPKKETQEWDSGLGRRKEMRIAKGKKKKKGELHRYFFPADSFPADTQGGKYKVIAGTKWRRLNDGVMTINMETTCFFNVNDTVKH